MCGFVPKGGVQADGADGAGAFGAGDGDEAAVAVAFGDAVLDPAHIKRICEQIADDGEPPALPTGGGDVCGVESLGDGCER